MTRRHFLGVLGLGAMAVGAWTLLGEPAGLKRGWTQGIRKRRLPRPKEPTPAENHFVSGLRVLESDPATAASELGFACALGHAEACSYLGTMLRSGYGVRRNERAGIEYELLACVRGHRQACYALPAPPEAAATAAAEAS